MNLAKWITVLGLVAGPASTAAALDLEKGQRLYEEHCVRCHGDDGRPLLPQTPSFQRGETLTKSDEELIEIIRRGVGVMPGYEGIIRTRDLIDVTTYLRTLQR